MPRHDDIRRRRLRWVAAVLAVLVLFALSIDDWGRDLREHDASTTVAAEDPALRPYESRRTVPELVEGLRFAASRIGNWRYVGTAGDGRRMTVSFVATHRLLRLEQDITMTVEDLGNRRVVNGTSISRLALPDLGSNPDNLRRIGAELRAVLEGSVPSPIAAANLARR